MCLILTFEAEAGVEPGGIVAAVEVDDIETVVVVAVTDEQGAEAVTGGIVAATVEVDVAVTVTVVAVTEEKGFEAVTETGEIVAVAVVAVTEEQDAETEEGAVITEQLDWNISKVKASFQNCRAGLSIFKGQTQFSSSQKLHSKDFFSIKTFQDKW